MADFQKLNILLYRSRPAESENAGTVIDHIDAFGKYSGHNALLWSSMNGLPAEDAMAKIDCIVIHYTLSLLYDKYASQIRLIGFDGFPVLRSFSSKTSIAGLISFAIKSNMPASTPSLPRSRPRCQRKIYASLEGRFLFPRP